MLEWLIISVLSLLIIFLIWDIYKIDRKLKSIKHEKLEYAFLCEMQRKVDLYFRTAPDELIEKDLKSVQKKLEKLDF